MIINPRELTTSRIIEKISEGSLLSYHSILRDNFLIYEVKYTSEIFENIQKSKYINHICTITNDNIVINNEDYMPLKNDVLILSVLQKDSHNLEKIINDY